jgi:hypothetical protein
VSGTKNDGSATVAQHAALLKCGAVWYAHIYLTEGNKQPKTKSKRNKTKPRVAPRFQEICTGHRIKTNVYICIHATGMVVAVSAQTAHAPTNNSKEEVLQWH